ncbi:MAG TPA: hypothetical protein VF602_01620 [Pedobacter sp.]|jgi:hypothetical protein
MKTDIIFRKIGGILAEINEQYQYLSDAPENLNELELELLSANADFLAEHVKVLKKLNLTVVSSSQAEPESLVEKFSDLNDNKQSISPAAQEQFNSSHLMKQEFPESYSSFNRPVESGMVPMVAKVRDEDVVAYAQGEEKTEVEKETIESETQADPIKQPELSPFTSFFTPEPVAARPEVIEEPVSYFAPEDKPKINEEVHSVKVEPSVNNSFEDEQKKAPTLNEIISAQRAPIPTTQFNRQPVTDLKSIINLNDKLLFIKDLFNGYSLAYSEAIEIINRFDSFDAADNFLKTNYSAKNNWAAKQATAEKFYELLNRRFSK